MPYPKTTTQMRMIINNYWRVFREDENNYQMRVRWEMGLTLILIQPPKKGGGGGKVTIVFWGWGYPPSDNYTKTKEACFQRKYTKITLFSLFFELFSSFLIKSGNFLSFLLSKYTYNISILVSPEREPMTRRKPEEEVLK